MVRRDSSCESEIDRSSYSNNSDEIYYAETASIASSTSTDENCDNGLALDLNKCNPSFGKISVTNSNDVHFGNKTFYHGPVTIKQFLYASDKKLINCESAISDNGSVYTISPPTDNSLPNSDDYIKPISTNSESKNKAERAENKEGARWIRSLPRKHVVFVIILSIVLVTSLVISTAVLLTRNPISIANGIIGNPSNEIDQEENWGEPKGNESFVLPDKLKIIPRTEWLAKPPAQPSPSLKLPVSYVIIMHTATEACYSHTNCMFHVLQIQKFHVDSRKWWDIGYNFLVGGSGYAYEGRGWKTEGAHTYGYNSRSIGIALIGTFTSVLPLPRQLWATKKLIEAGVELGYIAKDYKLLGPRQLQSTESPGTLLFEEIKSWDHWTETP